MVWVHTADVGLMRVQLGGCVSQLGVVSQACIAHLCVFSLKNCLKMFRCFSAQLKG